MCKEEGVPPPAWVRAFDFPGEVANVIGSWVASVVKVGCLWHGMARHGRQFAWQGNCMDACLPPILSLPPSLLQAVSKALHLPTEGPPDEHKSYIMQAMNRRASATSPTDQAPPNLGRQSVGPAPEVVVEGGNTKAL